MYGAKQEIFEQLKSFFEQYSANLGEAVKLTDEEAKEYFKRNIASKDYILGQFYLVMDLKRKAITHQHDCDKNLDLNSEDNYKMTIQSFFDRIHPTYLRPYINFVQESYKAILNQENLEIKPLEQRFFSMFPFRITGNEYYWVAQNAVAFQVDENNQLLSHLNSYMLTIKYDNSQADIEGEFFDHQELMQVLTSEFHNLMTDGIMKKFTPTEKHVLALLIRSFKAENYNGFSSNKEIASRADVAVNTIQQHMKNIKKKLDEYMPGKFPSARDFVSHILKYGYELRVN